METCVQPSAPVRFSPVVELGTKPCHRPTFRVSSTVRKPFVMNSKTSAFRPLGLALFVTLLQLFVAVVLIRHPLRKRLGIVRPHRCTT